MEKEKVEVGPRGGGAWILGADLSWMAWWDSHGSEWVLTLSSCKNWWFKRARYLLLSRFLSSHLISAHTSSPFSSTMNVSSLSPSPEQMLVPCFLHSLQNHEPNKSLLFINYSASGIPFIASKTDKDND